MAKKRDLDKIFENTKIVKISDHATETKSWPSMTISKNWGVNRVLWIKNRLVLTDSQTAHCSPHTKAAWEKVWFLFPISLIHQIVILRLYFMDSETNKYYQGLYNVVAVKHKKEQYPILKEEIRDFFVRDLDVQITNAADVVLHLQRVSWKVVLLQMGAKYQALFDDKAEESVRQNNEIKQHCCIAGNK